MFGALATRLARQMTGRFAGVIVDRLVDAGEDAIVQAAGPFGGMVRSFLTATEANAIERARIRKQEHRAWLIADRRANPWRHNWQSQPRQPAGRPEGGEWMEGRLDYMAWAKAPVSRSQRRIANRNKKAGLRAVQAYKARRAAAGHTHSRTIRTSWGEF